MIGKWAAAVVVALSLASAAPAEQPSALLEKGVFQEETAGKLDEAAKIYQQIVDEATSNRRFVAEAQFRLGQCYQKQGKKAEAEAAFKRVAALFPDQKDLADKARKELGEPAQQLAAEPAPLSSKEAGAMVETTLGLINELIGGHESYARDLAIIGQLEVKMKALQACAKGSDVEATVRDGFSSVDRLREALQSENTGKPDRVSAVRAVMAAQRAPLSAALWDVVQDLARREKDAAGSAATPPKPRAVEGKVPDNAVKLSYTGDTSDKFHEIGGDGKAVIFTRPADAQKVVALQIFAGRLGRVPFAPEDEFSIYLLDADQKVLAVFPCSCSMIHAPEGDLRWYTLTIPPTAVPEKFFVLLMQKQKEVGTVALGWENADHEGHTWNGLPVKDELPATIEAMVRVYVAPAGAADKQAAEDLGAEAWASWQAQKWPDAEAQFKEALKSDPSNANVWNGLGWSQLNQGKRTNARDSFEKCLALDPTARSAGLAALNGLGWISRSEGKLDEAISWWKRLLEAASSAEVALNGLATVQMDMKKYDEAAKYYQMWLDANPNSADARAGLEKAKAAKK